jgi:glycosyltransferase involved in cell wall biosynthesis
MQENLAGYSCLFTGYLDGEELACAYASSDLFVFPSTTDTFGNVVMEAQASGVPVVVTNAGGPQENILEGETGLIVAADDAESLLDAVSALVADPERRRSMGIAARRYMEERSFENAFDRTWMMYHAPKSEDDCTLDLAV